MTVLCQPTHTIVTAAACHLMHHFLLECREIQTLGGKATHANVNQEKQTQRSIFSSLLLMEPIGLLALQQNTFYVKTKRGKLQL